MLKNSHIRFVSQFLNKKKKGKPRKASKFKDPHQSRPMDLDHGMDELGVLFFWRGNILAAKVRCSSDAVSQSLAFMAIRPHRGRGSGASLQALRFLKPRQRFWLHGMETNKAVNTIGQV